MTDTTVPQPPSQPEPPRPRDGSWAPVVGSAIFVTFLITLISLAAFRENRPPSENVPRPLPSASATSGTQSSVPAKP